MHGAPSLSTLYAAADLYGVDGRSLTPLGGVANSVFAGVRVRLPVVVRLHRVSPDEARKAAAQAELGFAFAAHLASFGVHAAEPIRSCNGQWAEVVSEPSSPTDAGDRACVATCVAQAQGTHVTGPESPGWGESYYRAWGSLLARAHAGAGSFGRAAELPTWHEWHRDVAELAANEGLADAWDAFEAPLAGLPQAPSGFGPVHNDLHQHNMLVAPGGHITVIDFDSCARSWFALEIAAAVFHAQWECMPGCERPSDFASRFLAVFMEGYHECSPSEPWWMDQLPLLMAYRRLFVCICLSHAWGSTPNPWQAYWLNLWRSQIASDVPALADRG